MTRLILAALYAAAFAVALVVLLSRTSAPVVDPATWAAECYTRCAAVADVPPTPTTRPEYSRRRWP